MLSLLWILLVCYNIHSALSCPPRRPSPKPCSWRTCNHEWSNSYQPVVLQGQCVKQSRSSKHIYSTHHSTAPCPASQSCNWRTQSRTRCSCRDAYSCTLQKWTPWAGHVPNNQCVRQTRSRGWNEKERYVQRDGNCNGVRSSCGSRENDYRTYCSCQYVRCETLPWTAWSEVATESGHCRTEARHQRQRKTIVYKHQLNNCNGVGPQSCPQDVTSKREKVVYCSPLPQPSIGRWDRNECHQSRQRCKSLCTLECTGLTGYKRVGTPTRTCQSSGSWSASDAYCKDVQAPVIKCPPAATYSNDPGKTYKRVTLPAPTVSDNSGKAPTITRSIKSAQHDFGIARSSHEVVYTARDSVGLTDQCTWYVTVKDMEKPKVLSCPSDIMKTTTRTPERIAWKEPEFKDNYDNQPVISGDKVSGSEFYYGKTKVLYQAVDNYGNVATCQFFVSITALQCPMFEPPKHGAQTCNMKVNDKFEHQLYCTTQCQQKYAYISDNVFDIYQCGGGQWQGLNNNPPILVPFPKDSRPWVDCTEQDNAEGVKKVINAYVGECNENDPEALAQIKQNFINSINSHILSQMLFCSKHEKNCHIDNVKVYCGKSKRSGDTAKQVISVEIVVRDSSTDKSKAQKQHQSIKMDLDATEMAADKDIVSDMKIKDAHIEGYGSKLACKVGEVVYTKRGEGDELSRSSCVKCVEGTYYDKDEEECIPCSEGTYQDQEGETSCKKCPEGTWTVGAQASNRTECLDVCAPGEYSQKGNGLANCLACPKGTFQRNFRQSSCIKCPSGKTTKFLGTASEDDCE